MPEPQENRQVLHRIDGRRGGVGRHYARLDLGRIVPSVTTVVSLTPKPYLMNWVVKLAAEWVATHTYDLMPMTWEERVAIIKAETRALREEGARKGTALHDYAEQYVWLGTVEPPRTLPEQAVIDIVDQLQPNVLFTEAMVWNGTVGYAGTLDGVWEVTFDGRVETWVIDWKTSKSRSAEWALQQEAYRRAETIFDGRGNEYPMPHIDRCVILWTPFDGDWAVLPVQTTEQDWEAFCASLRVLRWHDQRGVTDVLGPPLYGLTSAPSTETGAQPS
jgi:hypothetical protein